MIDWSYSATHWLSSQEGFERMNLDSSIIMWLWLLPQLVARQQLSFASWSGRLTGRQPRFHADAPFRVVLFWVERSATDLPERLHNDELVRSGEFRVGLPAGEVIGDIVGTVCD